MGEGKRSILIGAGKMAEEDDDKLRLRFANYIGLRFLAVMAILAGAVVIMEKC